MSLKRIMSPEEVRFFQDSIGPHLKELLEHHLDYRTKRRLTRSDKDMLTVFGLQCYLQRHFDLTGEILQLSEPLKPLPDEGNIS